MFGVIGRVLARAAKPIASAASKGTGAVLSIPGVRQAVKAVPLGAAALSVGGALLPQGRGGLPALPGGALPDVVGQRGIFQNDPNIAANLQGMAISKANLRVAYRSPIKGFVVLRDEKGDPFAIPKNIAKAYYGWKPAKKPPISAGDWAKLAGANRVINKLKTMEKMARKVANFGSRRPAPRNIIIEQPGRKVIGRKVA